MVGLVLKPIEETAVVTKGPMVSSKGGVGMPKNIGGERVQSKAVSAGKKTGKKKV